MCSRVRLVKHLKMQYENGGSGFGSTCMRIRDRRVLAHTHIQYGDVLGILCLELVLKIPEEQPFYSGAKWMLCTNQKVQWLL